WPGTTTNGASPTASSTTSSSSVATDHPPRRGGPPSPVSAPVAPELLMAGPGPQSCHLRFRGANSDVVVGGGAAFLLPPFDGADLGAIELEADSVACDRVVGDDLGAELLQGLVQAGLLLFGEVLEALFEPFEFGLVEAGSGSDVLRRYAAEGAGCAGQRPVDDDLLFTHALTLPEKRSPFHTVLCVDALPCPRSGSARLVPSAHGRHLKDCSIQPRACHVSADV